jgi:hypothetical protein
MQKIEPPRRQGRQEKKENQQTGVRNQESAKREMISG